MTDNRLTAEELDALTALERAATAKPWRQHAADSGLVIGLVSEASQHITAVAEVYNDPDMPFLLALRNAAPRLISSARALAEAEMRVTELEAALKPFAKEGDKWAPHVADDHRPEIGAHGTIAEFTVGDLRRACAARLLAGETK